MTQNSVIITSGNGLVLVWRKVISWTNVTLWAIGLLETKFSEFLIRPKNFFQENLLQNGGFKMMAILMLVDAIWWYEKDYAFK